MAYNFKSIADVEVVAEPAESANVLIEENGVIKKAPKTAVGGNDKWDAVVEWVDTDDEAYLTLISGDYNTAYNKIQNGEIPNILIRTKTQYGFIAYGAEKARGIVVSVNPDDSSEHSIVFERPNTCMNYGSGMFILWRQDNTLDFY